MEDKESRGVAHELPKDLQKVEVMWDDIGVNADERSLWRNGVAQCANSRGTTKV